MLVFRPTPSRERGRRILWRPSLPKRVTSNRRDHAKIVSRRNAAEARIRRFLKGFTANRACQLVARAAAGAGPEVGAGPKIQEPAQSNQDRAGSLAIPVHP